MQFKNPRTIRSWILIVLHGILLSVISHAQIHVEGKVYDQSGTPLIGVNVATSNGDYGTVTDTTGYFELVWGESVHHSKLTFTYIGFEDFFLEATDLTKPLVIYMTTSSKTLNEVVIKGKSQAAETRETVFKPVVMEMKKLSIQSSPVVQLIELMPGIKLRQNGGLGSNYNLIVNGVSGKGIPVVVDGIPVHLLSDGYQLNNISSDMIQQVEVYKGIVPVHFGVDALGGLIAIRTNRHFKSSLDASYSFGSWNTHQAYIGGKYLLDEHQYIAVNGTYQHSDNDYIMDDVQVNIDELGNTESRSVHRFHDDYDMLLGKVEYGFQQTSWADDFRISLSGNVVHREVQHGVTAIDPWGEVMNNSKSYNTELSWSKKMDNDRIRLSTQAGYGKENRVFVDTSSYAYSWDGKAYLKSSKGESGFYAKGRLPDIDFGKNYLRVMANYQISPTQELNFTSLGSYSTLQGTDIAATATFDNDIYNEAQHLTRIYTGLSWQSKWLDGKITNILALKGLYSSSEVLVINQDFTVKGLLKTKQHQIGYSDALKYNINDHWYAHLNYERSVRLPDEEEMFGDGLQILPNGTLRPEQSHNINLGISWKKGSEFYIGGFYRNISDQIFLNAITSTQTAYINFRATKTIGAEFSSSIRITPAFSTLMNGTWLRTELSKVDLNGTLKPRYIGSRIPNTPFCFGNVGFAYTLKDLLLNESNTMITFSNRFAYRYFLGWEIDGNTDQKATIPTQLLSDLSIAYQFPNKHLSISVECRNITDQKAYDNYKVQKPGRGFYTKVKMSF